MVIISRLKSRAFRIGMLGPLLFVSSLGHAMEGKYVESIPNPHSDLSVRTEIIRGIAKTYAGTTDNPLKLSLADLEVINKIDYSSSERVDAEEVCNDVSNARSEQEFEQIGQKLSNENERSRAAGEMSYQTIISSISDEGATSIQTFFESLQPDQLRSNKINYEALFRDHGRSIQETFRERGCTESATGIQFQGGGQTE